MMKEKINVLEYNNRSWVNKSDYDILEKRNRNLIMGYLISLVANVGAFMAILIMLFG